MAFNVLLRKQRFTGGDTTDEGKTLFRFNQQTNAARRTGDNFKHTLARQCLKVLFSGIWRTEAQTLRDFCTRRRHTRLADMIPNEIKHLLLPGR